MDAKNIFKKYEGIMINSSFFRRYSTDENKSLCIS